MKTKNMLLIGVLNCLLLFGCGNQDKEHEPKDGELYILYHDDTLPAVGKEYVFYVYSESGKK